MRCNQNCSCNRNNCRNSGQSDANFRNQQFNMNRGQFNRPSYNECNVFAAATTTATTVTGTAATPLELNNILYSYGSAIKATSGGSRIYITQPGLYQVSYSIDATNAGATGAASGVVTAYLLRNTTQFGTTTSTSLDVADSAFLSDTEIFYVSCQDLPVTLELTASSMATVTNYTCFITINKICTCEGYSSGMGSFDDSSNSFFGDGSFGDGSFGDSFNFGIQNGGPGPVIGGCGSDMSNQGGWC